MPGPKKMYTSAETEYLKHLGNDGRDLMAMAIAALAADKILTGMMVGAPNTPSSQATGAGTLAVRVNEDKGVISVGGQKQEYVAQADLVLFNAASPVASGQSVVIDAVAYLKHDGTVNIIGVPGVAATTGQQVAPTDAQVEAAVLAADGGTMPRSWLRLGRTTVNRTGDTTVTQSYDNTPSDRGFLL